MPARAEFFSGAYNLAATGAFMKIIELEVEMMGKRLDKYANTHLKTGTEKKRELEGREKFSAKVIRKLIRYEFRNWAISIKTASLIGHF